MAEEFQAEELKQALLSRILSSKAKARLARVRLVKPELAAQVEVHLIQLYQAGRIREEVSDAQLVKLLEALSRRREFKIVRK